MQVPAAIPTWAGPAVTAQLSTAPGAPLGTSLPSLAFVLLQMFRKFICIRRGKTRTTATEGTAEPDSGLSELQAEPDVSTDSECSEDSDSPMNDHTAKTDVAVTEDMAVTKDMAVTEDMTITNTDTGETQGIPNTDTTPIPTGIHAPKLGYFKESAASPQQQASSLGPGLESPRIVCPLKPRPLGPLSLWDQKSESRREAFLGGSWGSCSLGQCSKSSPCLLQVPAMVRNIHQRLGSHVTGDARLGFNLLRLAEEHPADVVLTLLRCAPSCDRYGAQLP